MRLSEMIDALSDVIDKRGDVDIVCCDGAWYYRCTPECIVLDRFRDGSHRAVLDMMRMELGSVEQNPEEFGIVP